MNGFLGKLAVVGQLTARPGPQSAFDRTNFSAWALPREGASLDRYSLLPPCTPAPLAGGSIAATPDGSLVFEAPGLAFAVDRWGNPTPGPNAGRDLAAEGVDFFRVVGTAAANLAMARDAAIVGGSWRPQPTMCRGSSAKAPTVWPLLSRSDAVSCRLAPRRRRPIW